MPLREMAMHLGVSRYARAEVISNHKLDNQEVLTFILNAAPFSPRRKHDEKRTDGHPGVSDDVRDRLPFIVRGGRNGAVTRRLYRGSNLSNALRLRAEFVSP